MTAINRDFVVKNGLQVSSNLVVGTYTGPSAPQIAYGAAISGNVGIGTGNVITGSMLQVMGGNVYINSPNTGILFQDGTLQTTAAANTSSFGILGTIQLAGAGNTFSGDTSNLFYDTLTGTLEINGGKITLDNGTANLIDFGINGVDYPYLSSNGDKIYLYNDGGGGVYSLGVDPSPSMYFNVPYSSGYRWYGGGCVAATLSGVGDFFAQNSVTSYNIAAQYQLGIGTNTPFQWGPQLLGVFGDQLLSGNLYITNTAYTTSGIVFPDGSFLDTANQAETYPGQPVGSIQYNDSNTFGGSSNFIFDAVNTYVGIGTGTPLNTLDVWGSAGLTGDISANGTASVNYLISNNDIITNTLEALGEVTVYDLISNNNITTDTLVANTLAQLNQLIVNSDISTTNLYAFGLVEAQAMLSNTNVVGVNLQSTGLATFASMNSNSTIQVAGVAQVNELYSNTYIHAGLTITANKIKSNTFVQADTYLLANQITSNTNVVGANLQSLGLASVDSLVVNNGSYFNTLVVQNGAVVGSLYSNSFIQAPGPLTVGSINSNGFAVVNSLTSNTAVAVASGGIQVAGNSNFSDNVSIGGNLNVFGTINSTHTNVVVISSPLIYLADGNPGDVYDIGMVGSYTTNQYYSTGIVRDHFNNVWTVFDTLTTKPNVITGTINWSDATITPGAFSAGNVYIVGNTPSTDYATGALQVTGGVGIDGNLYVSGNIVATSPGTVIANNALFYGDVNGFNAIYAGIPSGYRYQGNTILQLSANVNNYAQLNIENVNDGAAASTDIVATADNGSSTDTFIDLGINSSGYNQQGYGLTQANDGYLYVYGNAVTGGGNLVLSTYTANDIIFSLQGADYANEIARFSATQNAFLVKSNVASISSGTGAVQLTAGGAGIYGNINVGGQISLFSGNVGIGTANTTGITGNALTVFGTTNIAGNIYLANTDTISGMVFSDGTFQSTAAANTPSYGAPGTVQFAGAGNTFSGNTSSFFWDDSTLRVGIRNSMPTSALTVGSPGTTGNAAIFGAVGIGTDQFRAGDNLTVVAGNVNVATLGQGIVFPDGTFQTTASVSTQPGGSNNNVQFNNGGVLGGSNGFVYDAANVAVGIGTATPAYTLDVYGNIHIGGTPGDQGLIFPDGTVQYTALSGVANTEIQTFTFTALAGQNTFSVFPYTPGPQGVNLTSVFINGVYQRTTTYNWIGTNIILTTPAVAYARVEIKVVVAGTITNYGTNIAGSNVFNVQTAGITVYNTGFSYTPGYLDVYLNGVKLARNYDYMANDGLTIQFAAAPQVTSIVQCTGWNVAGSMQIQGSNVFNVQTSGVTTWSTGFPYTPGYLDVWVNGVKLGPGYDYNATDGYTVNFTVPPVVNSLVQLTGYAQGSMPGQLATQRKAIYVASAGQTVFPTQGPYVSPYVDVYVNGIKLVYNTDYQASDGNTVVLSQGLSAGANVEIITSLTFALGDVVRKSGDIMTGNLGIGTSYASSPFVVVGTSNFYGNVNVYGSKVITNDMGIGGNLTVAGFASVTGPLSTANNLSSSGNFSLRGYANFASNLFVASNVAVASNITVGTNVTVGTSVIFPDGSTQTTSANTLQQKILVLNDISSGFDGVTKSFNLSVGSSNININTPQQLLIVVGGAILAPFITTPDYLDLCEVTQFNKGYKLTNGNNIQFANAPSQQQDFSGRILSNVSAPGNTVTYPFKALNLAMADC